MTTAEKLTTIAENTPKVYEAGKKAEYDAFWDAYQANITGRNCSYLFAGRGWTKENCIPKYDVISPSSAYMMFALNPAIEDMREFKKSNGEKVVFDFSGTTEMTYAFYRTGITYIETVDCTSATSLAQIFSLSSELETIELLKLKQDGSNTLSSAFNCSKLKNITIEGVIGYNNTEFTSTVLTKASLYSIINALSTTTSGRTIKLKKAAVNKAFETETDLNDGIDSSEWDSLVKTKTNWTITLT